MIRKALITLFATFAISATVSAAPIEFHEFDTVDQEQQFKELSNTLRCPKCQN
ncbi:cytochrome c-type biogenesis protein CcmH, partial [Vibrio sp. 10N.222.54.A1]